MKFQISNFKFQIRRGYTLIEIMVVIAIMGLIATIGFYALKNQDKSQAVINAQRDFLNNMRSVQNNIRNGVGGQAVMSVVLTSGTSSYTVVNSNSPFLTQSVSLPSGVTLAFSGGPTLAICVANTNLLGYSATVKCASVSNGSSFCVAGSGYVCTGTTITTPASLDINFTNGTVTKTVRTEGSGMNIGRIYATN